jgi:mannose-6-phosphate isomerase
MKPSGPIQFAPLYQPRLWGGRRLQSLLGRRLPAQNVAYGESWELCDRADFQSVVVRGPFQGETLNSLWMDHRAAVFGRRFKQHPANHYPLLIKILDAKQALSIQVHPPAPVAAELGGQAKTEAWYVFQADPRSQIWAGFKQGVDMATLQQALDAGHLVELLQEHRPSRGECLFLPSGCVHALGAGLMVFEIQQNSDTTYRLEDWGRLDAEGKPRELHREHGLRCIDPTAPAPKLVESLENGQIAACADFQVSSQTLPARRGVQVGEEGEHLILMMVRGHVLLGGIELGPGDTVLLPASLSAPQRYLAASGLLSAKWLEIRLGHD